MRKRTWKVTWKQCPRPDGHERLARAVQMLIERAQHVSPKCVIEREDGGVPEPVASTTKES